METETEREEDSIKTTEVSRFEENEVGYANIGSASENAEIPMGAKLPGTISSRQKDTRELTLFHLDVNII